LRLARESNGNHSSGTFIENILTQNQNRPLSCLFVSPYWIQIGPSDLALGAMSPVVTASITKKKIKNFL